MGTKRSIDYCISLVKSHDYDSFLAGLLVPKLYRNAYFCVKAFNVEIASVKENANRNALAGRIRIQWWRETANAALLTDNFIDTQQPVAQAIFEHLRPLKTSPRWLERSVEARQKDLFIEQYDTLDELENYSEAAHSSLLYLLLETRAIPSEANLEYACSHIGVCHGLVTMLRALPFHMSQSILTVPKDLTTDLGVSLETLGTSEAGQKKLQDAVFEIASQANGHLENAKKLLPTCNKDNFKQALPFLNGPVTRSEIYLQQLRQANFNVIDGELLQHQNNHLKYQIKLAAHAFTKSL